MKRKITQILIATVLAIFPVSIFAQVASQGFDGNDTNEWAYTPSPTFYNINSGADFWEIRSSTDQISALSGDFVGGEDLRNANNATGNTFLTFDPVAISGSVDVSFMIQYKGYDSGDSIAFQLRYDNSVDWATVDQLVQINPFGVSGSTAVWTEISATVPPGNSHVRARLILYQNGSDEIGVDNFKIENAVVACTEPDVPAVSTNEIVTAGSPITLTMAGALNDATQWHAYTTSCGVGLAGSSAVNGSTISVTPGSGITTYYVRGEGGCTTPGSCGQVTVYAQGTITSTYTGGAWNNGTPNAAYHTIINDNLTAASEYSAYSLTVNSGSILDLNGNNLSITTDVTLESGGALLDDGFLTTIGGTQTLKRFMNADALTDFHLMSVPISNGDYEDSFQGSYAYRYVGGEYDNIYSFASGATMVSGEGVAMSGNGTAATERTYTGTFNKNLVDYTLISTDQWHLLGNPYPAPLSLSSFYASNNTTVRPTFYFFNESTGAYDTWNTSLSSGTGAATANAGVAQGFFLEELTPSATQVTYVGSMRANATNSFLRTAQEDNAGVLKLQLNNTETLIAWNEISSNDEDINDANYLQGAATSDIYSLLNDKARTIQAINNDFSSTNIPLGFYALEGGVNTISISNLSTDENIEVILIDRYDNTTHDLNAGAYEFMAEVSEEMIDDRFEIVLAKTSLSANENEALESGVIVSGGNALNVISENTLNYVRVYDITGALVHEAKNINNNNFRWNAEQANAIYIIEVATEDFTSNHKITLK